MNTHFSNQELVIKKFPDAYVRQRFEIFEVCIPLSRKSPREHRRFQHYTHEECGILGVGDATSTAWESAAKETGVATEFLCTWCRNPYSPNETDFVHGHNECGTLYEKAWELKWYLDFIKLMPSGTRFSIAEGAACD